MTLTWIVDGAVRFICDYCRRDLTNIVRIKCAICSDFDLCVECFTAGAELSPHKRDHDYRVMDNLSFPIFAEDWGADDELLLLEGIEMYGLGNWADIADLVATKTKEECERHYLEAYINVPTCPLPVCCL